MAPFFSVTAVMTNKGKRDFVSIDLLTTLWFLISTFQIQYFFILNSKFKIFSSVEILFDIGH
jgi:hypothetical protein